MVFYLFVFFQIYFLRFIVGILVSDLLVFLIIPKEN